MQIVDTESTVVRPEVRKGNDAAEFFSRTSSTLRDEDSVFAFKSEASVDS